MKINIPTTEWYPLEHMIPSGTGLLLLFVEFVEKRYIKKSKGWTIYQNDGETRCAVMSGYLRSYRKKDQGEPNFIQNYGWVNCWEIYSAPSTLAKRSSPFEVTYWSYADILLDDINNLGS